jgi:hypothetical protein
VTRYALYNKDLGRLLDGAEPRPKLRLILRARAKVHGRNRFVEQMVALYRQLGEGGFYMSPARQAALEKIASGGQTGERK